MVRPRARIWLWFCVWLGLAVHDAAAQSPGPPPAPILIEYSTVAEIRNAALIDAALRFTERGADVLVDLLPGDVFGKKTKGGFYARLGKFVAFDAPLVLYGSDLAHEHGHSARAEELGLAGTVVMGSPWSGSRYFIARGRPLTAAEILGVAGGGLEGARVLADRVESRMHAEGAASPYDLAQVVISAVRSERYILSSLSEHRLEYPQRFFIAGDPTSYAINLTAVRLSLDDVLPAEGTLLFPEIRSTARSIRKGSLINFLDYGLATAAVALGRNHLWRGERRIRSEGLALGALSIVPSLRYTLSPIGPERQVRSRFRIGGSAGLAYVRWSEALEPGSGTLIGAGGQYRRVGFRRLDPAMSIDVWRNPDGSGAVRGEMLTTWRRAPGDRLMLSLAVGAKGRGYLLGYPLDSGVYATAGGGFRF